MIDDIDSDEDSEIVDESEDDGIDLEDFIVPDDEVDGMVIPPPNHATIDKEWNDWEPGSPGSMRFKEIVNVIETHAKIQADITAKVTDMDDNDGEAEHGGGNDAIAGTNTKSTGTTAACGSEPNPQGGPRRSKHHNPWGLDETQALIEGVSRCGGGKWADIKKLGFPEIEHRTAVDLKDKWRNLLRTATLPTPSGRETAGKSGGDKKREIPRAMLDRVRELAMLHAKLKARDAGHTLEDTVDDGNKETYTSQLEATFPALIDGSHLSVEKPKEDGADVGEEREDAAAAAAAEEEELDNDNNKNNNNNSGDASEDDDDDDMPIRGSHHRARKSGSPPTEEELKEAVFEIIVRVKEGGGKRISTKEVRKELEKKFGCSLKAYKEKIQDCIYFKVIDRDTTIVRKKRNNSRKEGSRLKRKRELKTEQDVKDDVRETEGVAEEEEVKEEEREVKKRPQRKKKVKKLRKSNPLRYADSDASSSDDDDEDDDEEEGEEEKKKKKN